MEGPPPCSGDGGETRSEIEHARVQGDVIQARDVSGGVHFHAADAADSGPGMVPHQLPADVSAFINRRTEIRALTRYAGAAAGSRTGSPTRRARGEPTAVVVITGSAGVGKTALALHWAHRVREDFPDGELYVNLRGFDEGPPVSAEAALDRFLRDLGISPEAIPAELDARAAMFRSLVADRRILIVIDNAADVDQVRPLVPGDGPFVIVTSRNQLTGLAIRDGARRIRLDIFAESDAAALLRRVTRSGGRADAPGDLTELARLCARLPLALRVAAEHAVSRPTMRLAELIADLRDGSMLWDVLSAGEGSRGEAVRTVFAWSYRDLSPEAARMFRVLGLHRGPDISLPAAAAAAGTPAREARRSLDILLGAFLVETERPGRYQLHDLLRAYALDQARTIDSESGRRAVTDRILRYYIVTGAHVCEALLPGRFLPVEVPDASDLIPASFQDPAAAFEWFDTERPNLVSNARTALESGLPRRGWELAMVLSPIHASYFTFDDWSVLSEIGVAAAEGLDDPAALAAALDNRGNFYFRRRLLDDARAVHSRALAIRQEIGDRLGVIESLNALGLIGLRTRDLAEAAAYFADTANRAHEAGDPWWENVGRMNQAEAQIEQGHATQAMEILLPVRLSLAERGERADEGNALWLMGWAQRLLGDRAGALAATDAALRIAEDLNNRMLEAHWLTEAARIHLALGDTGEAMRCCRMAASLQRQIGDHSREATALDCTGDVMLATGNATDAAAFYQQAARMHRQLGDGWNEALATAHLAGALAALGQDDASRETAARALALIGPFTDDRAAQLKTDLRGRLEERE